MLTKYSYIFLNNGFFFSLDGIRSLVSHQYENETLCSVFFYFPRNGYGVSHSLHQKGKVNLTPWGVP
jgi:hypothetical protein